jgi:SAM-dependent methyltransferase
MSGFQLSGDAPTAYTRFALKIVEPWTDDLILAASCRDGDRVLDVACGTGVVASRVNLVSRKLCYVTGIDINEGMLNVARANSQVEWHQGSATELPFGEASFDVVLCQQGLQYFPDRTAAMREMAAASQPECGAEPGGMGQPRSRPSLACVARPFCTPPVRCDTAASGTPRLALAHRGGSPSKST